MLKHMLLAGIATLFLVACRPAGSGPPPIRLVMDGAPVDGHQGSYCWAGLCVDILEPELDQSVVTGTPLQFELGRPTPDRVFMSLSNELFGDQLITNEVLQPGRTIEWDPQIPPGTYVMNITAQWSNGDGSWFYRVMIP